MENFSNYYSEEVIIKMLCGYRAKHSNRRHKLHKMRDISLHDTTKKIKVINKKDEFTKLQELFPSRRKWKKLNLVERKLYDDSLKRTSAMLFKSYKLYKRKNIPFLDSENWYKNLLNFVTEVQNVFNELDSYCMESPKIIGILKKIETDKTEYRPIALYELKDRIISSVTAKYLTDFFDSYFLSCSFAFRSSKNKKKFTHHKTIEEIIEYRNLNKKIWVSECDIQKFFDAVNHKHIINVFNEHINIVAKSQNKEIDNKAKKIFNKFLDSFAFNLDVYPKNLDNEWKAKNNLKKNGYFKWIEKTLIKDYGSEYLNQRIGVAQGNAISCFISNLLLHNIDSKVLSIDKSIFYIRFCDDMVLMHFNEEVCNSALELYKKELNLNFLSYHNPVKCNNYLNKEDCKKFWKSKSKEPYLWDNPNDVNNSIPWLSFVGYQVKYNQEIRIRKQSIEKEKRKQVKQVENIFEAIGLGFGKIKVELNFTSRKSRNQLIHSLSKRLQSMSVGRIEMYNFKKSTQGLCWTSGFKIIRGKKNKIISKQLKQLDSFREKQISRLIKNLDGLEKESHKPENDNFKEDEYFGSPYSYHNYLINHLEEE